MVDTPAICGRFPWVHRTPAPSDHRHRASPLPGLASSGEDHVFPGQRSGLGRRPVVPNSASRCVFVESEQVVETLLNGVHLREHPPCPGTPSLPLAEQDGLLDSTQV